MICNINNYPTGPVTSGSHRGSWSRDQVGWATGKELTHVSITQAQYITNISNRIEEKVVEVKEIIDSLQQIPAREADG
jgi:hypothetical protein